MTKEEKFYKVLQDVFIGATIEGTGGFVNLMRIKSNYYRKIEDILKEDIKVALKNYPKFKDELFDKLYSFFSRYFTESGSIYFNSTPFHNNIYEKVYTDEKDVILFWKTQMLYYVKTDRIFRSLPVEFDGFKFYFDASKIENKKANEKRSLVFELINTPSTDADTPLQKGNNTIVFNVKYSEKGTKTKQDEILKAIKRKGIAITEEQLERAFRVFEKQSEVDFFINKNAKAFLQEQFKLWCYQYFWEGAKEWGTDRVNELQILKDIAFKIIDFVAQFEDELVKIWSKPKFVKNSNYVITLDRIKNENLIEKIIKHEGIKEQIKEWQELGIVDKDFKLEDIFENSPLLKGWHSERMTGYLDLPYNPKLKEKARELRKAENLAEVLLWNELKQKKMLGLDFTRQQIIGDYIVGFYCSKLNLVIEIDGQSHDEKVEYDKKRDEDLRALGLTVLHFQDEDIKKNLSGVVEAIKRWIENTPSASQTPLLIKGEFRHLPIDTKYFKDLEIEILDQFDDLDKSLDGWLIKSENYQALNTILPKFKEKVQTIYIDPPFNKEQDADYFYSVKYKDSSWATLLENRLQLAKDILNEKGSIFVRCDYNGNWIVRPLMNDIFGKENFRNEIAISRISKQDPKIKRFNTATDSLFFYSKTETFLFNVLFKKLLKAKVERWHAMDSQGQGQPLYIFGYLFNPPRRRHWTYGQESIKQMESEKRIRLKCRKCGYVHSEGIWQGCPKCKLKDDIKVEYLLAPTGIKQVDSNWTDISGYTSNWDFQTENSEILLKRTIETSSNLADIVFDFFLGSGTTTAVAHKLGRKWIGVEMGEHFYSVVLPRMKKVLSYDKSGISKDLMPRRTSSDTPLKEGNYQGGGFFKYYELEQYEEALANCKYEDGDLFNSPSKTPYEEYVFMKDEKMLKALEIDYENEKVKVDLSQLYPNIDIAETLSNLTGKWIKKISDSNVEFEDGTKINIKDLDYKLIKPLVWWE